MKAHKFALIASGIVTSACLALIFTDIYVCYHDIVISISFAILVGSVLLFGISYINYKIYKKKELLELWHTGVRLHARMRFLLLSIIKSNRIHESDIKDFFIQISDVSNEFLMLLESYHDGLFLPNKKDFRKMFEDVTEVIDYSNKFVLFFAFIEKDLWATLGFTKIILSLTREK